MQRPNGRNGRKAEKDQQPDNDGERAVEIGHFPQHQNVERLDGREMVNQQDAHQREHRSRRKEQRELHRGVFLAVRPEVQDEPDRITELAALGIGHAQIPFGMTPPDTQQHVHG